MNGHDNEQIRRLIQERASESDADELLDTWNRLELPPPPSAPLGFADRILAEAHSPRRRWVLPVWWGHTALGRAASVGLLVLGIGAGALIASATPSEDWADELVVSEPTLAEKYWDVLDADSATLLEEVQP